MTYGPADATLSTALHLPLPGLLLRRGSPDVCRSEVVDRGGLSPPLKPGDHLDLWVPRTPSASSCHEPVLVDKAAEDVAASELEGVDAGGGGGWIVGRA